MIVAINLLQNIMIINLFKVTYYKSGILLNSKEMKVRRILHLHYICNLNISILIKAIAGNLIIFQNNKISVLIIFEKIGK